MITQYKEIQLWPSLPSYLSGGLSSVLCMHKYLAHRAFNVASKDTPCMQAMQPEISTLLVQPHHPYHPWRLLTRLDGGNITNSGPSASESRPGLGLAVVRQQYVVATWLEAFTLQYGIASMPAPEAYYKTGLLHPPCLQPAVQKYLSSAISCCSHDVHASQAPHYAVHALIEVYEVNCSEVCSVIILIVYPF